jgi:hypothetical protein
MGLYSVGRYNKEKQMMHHQKLVASIKANGKVLREFGETVLVPFGSEYSIFLKNLHVARVQVGITIDGKDILGGSKLIINGNSSIDLERFVELNDRGHKLKFVERTESIEKHRGISAEDGLIRIEYEYEQYQLYRTPFRSVMPDPVWINGGYNSDKFYDAGGVGYDKGYGGPEPTMCCTSLNDAGITAKGDISDQKFVEVYGFNSDGNKHSMVIQLKGEHQGKQVAKPISVSVKQECENCGRKNKATAKFCSECGTSLVLL